MDIASITLAYEGLKTGKSILQSLYETKIEADAKEKIEVVMSKLGEAQDSLFTMREELFRLQSDNDTLKNKIGEIDSWENKFSQYELVETLGGAVVYRFLNTPKHFICPSCISRKKIEILQNNRTPSGKFRCIGCKSEYPINPRQEVSSVSFTDMEL
ncbi:MAG: hypothetical protein KAG56_10310 [Sulfurovaceae bacterium]|nr:hypothetical protein [Sulfurovaceae bacterium]